MAERIVSFKEVDVPYRGVQVVTTMEEKDRQQEIGINSSDKSSVVISKPTGGNASNPSKPSTVFVKASDDSTYVPVVQTKGTDVETTAAAIEAAIKKSAGEKKNLFFNLWTSADKKEGMLGVYERIRIALGETEGPNAPNYTIGKFDFGPNKNVVSLSEDGTKFVITGQTVAAPFSFELQPAGRSGPIAIKGNLPKTEPGMEWVAGGAIADAITKVGHIEVTYDDVHANLVLPANVRIEHADFEANKEAIKVSDDKRTISVNRPVKDAEYTLDGKADEKFFGGGGTLTSSDYPSTVIRELKGYFDGEKIPSRCNVTLDVGNLKLRQPLPHE